MAGAQIQLLQFAADPAADNLPASVTWTLGDWVHIVVVANEAACTTTLLDDLGNTFNFIGSERESAINTRVHHYYANITTGGAATLTARWFSDTTPFGALAVSWRQMIVKRMSGVNGYQAGGAQDVLSANPTQPCVVANSSQPAYLSLVGINMQSGTFTADVGNGWTDDGFVTGSGGGGSLDGRLQSKSVITVGSQSGSLINASSDRGVVVMAIFSETLLAPTIVRQPNDVTVDGSRPVTLSVIVTNPDTYQWYDNSGGSFAAVSGATGASYPFQATAAMNGRQFYVIATNGGGSIQSDTVTLTVTAAQSRKYRTSFELLPRGGADVWDDGAAGVSLVYDTFDQAAGGTALKVWDGAAHVVKPLKYWDSAAWTTKPLKRWNGSAWV